jgi:hypothetical protein
MIRRSFFKALSTLAALPVVGKLLPEPESEQWVMVTCVWYPKEGIYKTWIDGELVSVVTPTTEGVTLLPTITCRTSRDA